MEKMLHINQKYLWIRVKLQRKQLGNTVLQWVFSGEGWKAVFKY